MIQFLFGKNSYLISKELKNIEASFAESDPSGINLERIDGGEMSYAQFDKAVSTMPFLAEKRMVVVRDLMLNGKDAGLKNRIAEKLGTIVKGSLQQGRDDIWGKEGTTDIIFVEFGEPDKRQKLFKDLIKNAENREFSELQGAELEKWIIQEFRQQGVEIARSEASFLALEAGSDMVKLSNEIIKIALLVKNRGRSQVERSDIEALVVPENDPNVFEFVEAISRKDGQGATRLLFHFLQNGESEMRLLGMMAYQARTLIMVKDCLGRGMSSSQIAKDARLHPFVVQKSLQTVRQNSLKKLISIYDQICRTDYAIKSGAVAPPLAIDILVTTLCK